MANDLYELFYWPTIQGRGEFVRLLLEESGAPYVDVARRPESEGGGAAAIMRLLRDPALEVPPFAPPILRVGSLVIAQTANVCAFLAARHDLVPRDDARRIPAHQIQLTIGDLVAEAHDTHHPVAVGRYYEEQKAEAARRAEDFRSARMPKFLGWFDRTLGDREGLLGSFSYVDLSLFQILSGLEYAFPRSFARCVTPRLLALRDRIAARPRIAAYLASPRRLPFGEHGIFRRYPELDP